MRPLTRLTLIAAPLTAVALFAAVPTSASTDTTAPAGTAAPEAAPAAEAAPTTTRWLYVDHTGAIVSQSGGFTVAAAYPVLENTAEEGQPDNSLRANGNVYIDAGQDLTTSAIVATLTLQNTVDVDGNGMAGRSEGADANAEFSGEITVSVCNFGAPADPPTGPTNCAPPEAQNGTSFVVSPRHSDGSVTTDDTRKSFYIVIVSS